MQLALHPLPETLVMDILHTTCAFAEIEQLVILVVGVFKADAAFFGLRLDGRG